jgi:hypothetical protein
LISKKDQVAGGARDAAHQPGFVVVVDRERCLPGLLAADEADPALCCEDRFVVLDRDVESLA